MKKIIAWIKCMRQGHRYRPWFYVRQWRGRYSNNVGKEERQYECCHCGKKTEWMCGDKRRAFEKKHKPAWTH